MNKKILLSLALLSTLSAVDKFKAGDIISADVMNEAFDSITRVPTTADLVGSWSCRYISRRASGCTASWTRHTNDLYYYADNATLDITDNGNDTYSFEALPNLDDCTNSQAFSGNISTEAKALFLAGHGIPIEMVNRNRFVLNYGFFADCKRVDNVPQNPQELTVTVSSNINILSWSDLSTFETEFNILRKDSINGEWQVIDTVNQNTTIYEDVVTETKPYWYRVQAKNTTGTSLGSNVATTAGSSIITLTSTDVKNAIDSAVNDTVTLSDTDIISTINTTVSTAIANIVEDSYADSTCDPYADSTYDPYANSTYDPYADSTSE